MSDFQREVGEWAERTFPQSMRLSVVAHLFDEVQELTRAVIEERIDQPPSAQQVIDEAADCYLLLLHLAYKCHFDLEEAAAVKHIRNTRRQWGEPDSRGVVKHVEVGG